MNTTDTMLEMPYIIIDGLDASGKSTQVKMLRERIERMGRNMVFTREPGGAPLSEEIRTLFKSELGMNASALTQSLLNWAARRNYLEEVAWPALKAGTPIFSDRGDSSTFAYQIFAKQARELEEEFWHMRSVIFGDSPPTLYILLDVTPEVALERMARDTTRSVVSGFDAESLDFFQRVYEGFHAFCQNPEVSARMIDGESSRDVVHQDICRVVDKACGW